jgi:hypothetical protein
MNNTHAELKISQSVSDKDTKKQSADDIVKAFNGESKLTEEQEKWITAFK